MLTQRVNSWAYQEISPKGGVLTIFFEAIYVFTERSTNLPEKQLDPKGPTASHGVSIPVFRSITTCDFPGMGSGRPVTPSGSAHAFG